MVNLNKNNILEMPLIINAMAQNLLPLPFLIQVQTKLFLKRSCQNQSKWKTIDYITNYIRVIVSFLMSLFFVLLYVNVDVKCRFT